MDKHNQPAEFKPVSSESGADTFFSMKNTKLFIQDELKSEGNRFLTVEVLKIWS